VTLRLSTVVAALAVLPTLAAAQMSSTPPSSSPLADALRSTEARAAKNLSDAADEMPADKYSYKPTDAQMTFGKIMTHLAEGNDFLCGTIGGMKAPTRSKVSDTDSKDALVARLKETFAFCDQAIKNLDDSKLAEQVPMFGGKTMSRAAVEMLTAADWADHYSQVAIYLRLNGLLPPTAKKQAM
jgi:uncharacterized damage-inducible protein DinB